MPDVHGFTVDGKAFFIEGKAGNNKMSVEQIEFITRADACHCMAFKAATMDEVKAGFGKYGYAFNPIGMTA